MKPKIYSLLKSCNLLWKVSISSFIFPCRKENSVPIYLKTISITLGFQLNRPPEGAMHLSFGTRGGTRQPQQLLYWQPNYVFTSGIYSKHFCKQKPWNPKSWYIFVIPTLIEIFFETKKVRYKFDSSVFQLFSGVDSYQITLSNNCLERKFLCK